MWIFRALPWAIAVGSGVYLVLSAFFPSLREEDFDKYETSVEVWAPFYHKREVIDSGTMPERTAVAWAIFVGAILIVGGLAGLLYSVDLLPLDSWTSDDF
jgi:hypothetical protein